MKMKSFILKYASKIMFYDVNIACYHYLPHLRDLWNFLRHFSFYWRFILDFSKVSKPLTNLLCKKKDFMIDKERKEVF